MVYSNNFSKYEPEYSTNVPLVNIEDDIPLDLKTYFVIHLGLVDTKWDTEMYNHFTTTIDNSRKLKNLLGFTVESDFTNDRSEYDCILVLIKYIGDPTTAPAIPETAPATTLIGIFCTLCGSIGCRFTFQD